jgi:rhodanese-related sulfurtransferase
MLSPARVGELAQLCFVENVDRDLDLFHVNAIKSDQILFLLKGYLELRFEDGSRKVLCGGSKEARLPIGEKNATINNAIALSKLEILRIDRDLLDIMMTWDQLAGYERSSSLSEAPDGVQKMRSVGGWMQEAGAFNLKALHEGCFSRLPPANIEEMFRRMSKIEVKAGQVIITQGMEGDYFYLIEEGVVEVNRKVDIESSSKILAELKEGNAFGEDALVSDNKRNATVKMKTDGILLRLDKKDFVELLKAPLLANISYAEAERKAMSGAHWLDIRFPSEYRFEHIPGAINTPLHEIRGLASNLNKEKEYIAYCQTGRRSSAAAFILAQQGFKVFVLEGGTRSCKRL